MPMHMYKSVYLVYTYMAVYVALQVLEFMVKVGFFP